ncbi:MAG: hypothetical protein GY865_03035 [candidate division Zixibacteria bacterium]|nr:hypothetical protein [candidate division Zixibacteria bacterium]
MNKKGFNRLYKIALVAMLALCPASIFANDAIGMATGNLTTADVAGFGVGYVGGHVGILDDATVIFGSLTYGLSDYTEGRVKIGFSDLDGSDTDPKLILGVDFKYEFMDYYDKNGKQPMDMAFGGFLEYVDYGAISVLELGGNYIASIPYRFKSGRRLIPYGRVNLRLESISVDIPGGNNDSDFKFGLDLGVKYELTTEMNLYGEFQFDGFSGLFLGLDVRMF